MVEVAIKGEERDAKDKVDALVAQTAAVQADHPELLLEETGSPSISKGVDKQRGEDLALSEKITLPVTLLTLLVVFGSLTMAAVPLVLALSSITAAIGLSMVASHVSPDTGIGTNVILMIGLAVGVDYTLFYLKREREERARAGGRLSSEALVELAAATSGRAVMVSGLAVVASTATLYLASDVIFSSLATGTIVVVLVAMASSLTALPALLTVLGRRAERRARRRAERGRPARRTRGESGGRVWTALLRPAARHPLATLCVSVLALLALTLPLTGLHTTEMSRDTHSREIPAMQVYDRLNEAFPEHRVTHQVVVRADADQGSEVAAALTELAELADADSLFSGASAVRTSADHRISTLELKVPHLGNSEQAYASLDHLRDDFVPGHRRAHRRRRVRRERGRRAVHRLSRPPERQTPPRPRGVAAGDLPDDAVRVPLGGARPDRRRTEPALRRRGARGVVGLRARRDAQTAGGAGRTADGHQFGRGRDEDPGVDSAGWGGDT